MPVVKTLPSDAGGMDSIPGWGTKIPHATMQCGLKKKKDCRLLSATVSLNSSASKE